jgi:hypothetical protein
MARAAVNYGTGRRAPEKRVQLAVRRALEYLGFNVTSFSQARASKQTPGIPDLYARHTGWQFRCWVEVKAPGKKPTLVQEGWHIAERRAGGIVLVVDSVDALVRELRAAGAPIR